MAWYDPNCYTARKSRSITRGSTEDLTDFPVLITDAVVQASLFTHARSDGADIVVTDGDGTTPG